MAQKTLSVLFVCTGNICRSPTAEAVFRKRIRELNPELTVLHDSAGTHGYHIGDPPDKRSIAVAQKRGVDMEALFARKLENGDFDKFDYIIAMDEGHERAINDLRPQNSKAIVKRLLYYHPIHQNADIPDPYYGTICDFEYTYSLIEEGVNAFLKTVLNEIS